MVAYLYLFVVKTPVSWAINPGVGKTSWSTEITSPGLAGGLGFDQLSVGFVRHGRLVALAYMHAEQTGTWHVASRFGRMPFLAISWSLAKDWWPKS